MNDNVQKYIYSKPLGKFINIEEYTEIFKKAMSTVTTVKHDDASHMFDNYGKSEDLQKNKGVFKL